MSDIKTIKLPESAHAIARKLYDDILALATERGVLMTDYMQARMSLEAKFQPQSEELIARINAVKLKGSEDICKAVGEVYDPSCGYSIDTSYLKDHGVAFMIVMPRVDGQRFDGLSEDMPAPGTKLN